MPEQKHLAQASEKLYSKILSPHNKTLRNFKEPIFLSPLSTQRNLMDQNLPTETQEVQEKLELEPNSNFEGLISRPLHLVPNNIPEMTKEDSHLLSHNHNIFISPCKRFIYILGLIDCLSKPCKRSGFSCFNPRNLRSEHHANLSSEAYCKRFKYYLEKEVFKPIRIVEGCEKGL